VLAALERVRRDAAAKGSEPPVGLRDLIGGAPREAASKPAAATRPALHPRDEALVSESSRTLVHDRRNADDATGIEPSRRLVQRPVGGDRDAPLSSESSGTLVLRPRTATIDDDLLPRPRAGAGATATEPPALVAQPPATKEVSESAKTLLRGDGTFESSRELMQKIETSRDGEIPPNDSSVGMLAAGRGSAREPVLKPGKTVLYADSTRASTPDPTAASAPEPAPESQDHTAIAPPPSSARGLPPSAVPTERHPLASTEPGDVAPHRGRKRKAVGAKEGDEPQRPRRSQPPRAGIISDGAPEVSRNAGDGTRRPTAVPRPRASATARYGWLWILLVLLMGGVGWGAYQAGLLDDLLGRDRSAGTKVAEAGSDREPSEPAPSGATPRAGAEAEAIEASSSGKGPDTGPTPASGTGPDLTTSGTPEPSTGEPQPVAAGSTGEPQPAATGSTSAPEPAAAESTGPPDTPDVPTPADDGPPDEPTSSGEPEPPIADTASRLSPEEQKLSAAVEQRRIFMLKTLLVTRRQGSETTFAGGWQRCATLEVDGVEGWRLPHRRELKLINAVLDLPSGVYWTRTVPDDDKSAAYVLDTSNGELSLFLKQEPNGDVVCVRRREHPDP
jgi:hypothetical protein